MSWVIGVAVFWVCWSVLGSWVASQKRRDVMEGFLLGLFFGPLGVIIEALLPTGDAHPRRRQQQPGKREPFSDVSFGVGENVTKDNIMGAIKQGLKEDKFNPFA